MPVWRHLDLLSKQFLAGASCPNHVSNSLASHPPGPRKMRRTLFSKFGKDVEPFLQDGILPPDDHKAALKQIHTSAVSASINALGPNRILAANPPPIHPSESSLPRCHRSTLSQLRSGWCRDLKSYKRLLNQVDDDECPHCSSDSHSSLHIFRCPSAPTNLHEHDLWRWPREAAHFFTSLPDFSHLPQVDPPPLSPRPSCLP